MRGCGFILLECLQKVHSSDPPKQVRRTPVRLVILCYYITVIRKTQGNLTHFRHFSSGFRRHLRGFAAKKTASHRRMRSPNKNRKSTRLGGCFPGDAAVKGSSAEAQNDQATQQPSASLQDQTKNTKQTTAFDRDLSTPQCPQILMLQQGKC